MATLVEGLWLSHVILDQYQLDARSPSEQAAQTALLMLWRGATRPAHP